MKIPRDYGHSNDIGDEGSEPDESGVVGRFLFVARGDPSTKFHAAKEAFNLIAIFIGCFVVSLFCLASRVGFDAHLRFQLFAALPDRIRIISCISEHSADLARGELF